MDGIYFALLFCGFVLYIVFEKIFEKLGKIMAELDDVKAAGAALQKSADANTTLTQQAITQIQALQTQITNAPAPGVLQAVADGLNAIKAQVDVSNNALTAVLAPPPPPPAP